jgi:hypothetical protein
MRANGHSLCAWSDTVVGLQAKGLQQTSDHAG